MLVRYQIIQKTAALPKISDGSNGGSIGGILFQGNEYYGLAVMGKNVFFHAGSKHGYGIIIICRSL